MFRSKVDAELIYCKEAFLMNPVYMLLNIILSDFYEGDFLDNNATYLWFVRSEAT